jgi:hypothetical protein
VGRTEQELNTPAGSGRGGARARAAALVCCLVAAAATCTDGGDRFTTHAPQVESRVEGEIDVFHAWIDGGTLVTLAPFHAAAGRDAYTKARLDERLGAGHLYASLSIWRFSGEGALDLGRDGIPVTARASSGSVASLPPSKWPLAHDDGAARPLLATLGGATLPRLEKGQTTQLLEVFATDAPFASLGDVRVTLGGRAVELAHGRANAVAWDEFRSQPAKERFEAAIGTKTAQARDGDEPNGEREGQR